MIVGNPSHFAIESSITKAYSSLSLRALGFFIIHLEGRSYGIRSEDATMMACSFDAVQRRLSGRGTHTAPFASFHDAGEIADSYRCAVYAPDQENRRFFGISQPVFRALIQQNQLVWAPDGDEAFDDRSYVLQFDQGDSVRLIGFKSSVEGYLHQPDTLSDLWIGAVEFYNVLSDWLDAFEAEWRATAKEDPV